MSSRFWPVLVAVAVFFGPSAEGGTKLVGTLDTNLSLTASGNPHHIEGTVTIPAGVTVKAGPGVQFTGDAKSVLAVKQKGALHLMGAKGQEIVLVRVGLNCRLGATLLAKNCRVSSPDQDVLLNVSSAGMIWMKDVLFSGSRIVLGNRGAIRMTNCRFSDCQVGFCQWGWTGPYCVAEDCRFSKCKIELGFMVMASKCEFKSSEFDWAHPADLGLRRPVVARTSTFCDQSWQSIQNALRRASFPEKRLTVKRAPSRKNSK